ncbi:MAG: molybdopterin-dependent oxidoreductase [Arenimonas sp.]
MTEKSKLPPGQRERADFPRFGLTQFAERFPSETSRIQVSITGDVESPTLVEDALQGLSRFELNADFHCVTTWTYRSILWSGFRFKDFYEQIAVPLAGASLDATFVVLRGQDGYRSSLPLEDLLAADVLLADRMNGEPLSVAHGAPLRLVAPAHYGYKSVKHIKQIEFWISGAHLHPIGFRFMAHPRARVINEERGQWVPSWLLRYLYRPFIGPTASRFERFMEARNRENQ